MYFKESSKWKKNHLHSSKSFFGELLSKHSITYFSSQTQLMFCWWWYLHLDIIQMMGNLVQCILKGGGCEWEPFPWLLLLFSLNNCLLSESSLDHWIHSSEQVIHLYIKLPIFSLSLISIYFHVSLFMNLIICLLVLSTYRICSMKCRDFFFHQSHFGL